MPCIYESWTETKKLYDPYELGARINKDEISILIVEADFIFQEVFETSEYLKFLGVCRTGLTHVDLDAATEHKVLVVNTPNRNAQAVAELTIGFMLSLVRQITLLDNYIKNGDWQDPVGAYIYYKGSELNGKTLGLIGLGRVGRIVSKLGNALGMNVIAHDPNVGHVGQRKYGCLIVPFDRVVTESNFLSLHSPSSIENTPLIGDSEFSAMKQQSFLINTAAHDLIDEDALARHIISGHIAGAALDVHSAHPIPPSNPLLHLENVILTPHVGGATRETIDRYSSVMLNEILRYIDGTKPQHLVNEEAWNDHEC